MRCVLLPFFFCLLLASPALAEDRPLVKDFLGLNGHTVQFKPKLYRPVCRLVRDYHPVNWDVGDETDYRPKFPFARNRVDWSKIYGSWREEGFEINCSLMLNSFSAEDWRDVNRDARRYGKAFAEYFGPSGRNPLVALAEIGNEPGHLKDDFYRKLFTAMARGLREGDPKLQIATCAAIDGKSHKYAKSLECVQGLEELYDVINLHTYAQVEGWPTWKRSFPEDPNIDYLQKVRQVIDWRNEHAAGKPIWITEYGWDACTRPAPQEGTFKKWVDVSDQQQAQYLVRSTLIFMSLDVDRAYIYWFNDSDKPQVHGSSGLTRNYQPKPSYHALVHFMQSLGNTRLVRVRRADPTAYVYEFADGTNPAKRVLVAWSPSGAGKSAKLTLDMSGLTLRRAERMPLKSGPAPRVEVKPQNGKLTLEVSESPTYVFAEREE